VSFVTLVNNITTTILTYALVTDPSPLQVSLAGADSSTADIQLVITNQQSAAVAVKALQLTVVAGSDPASLTDLTSTVLDVQWQPNQPWTVQPPAPSIGDNFYTLTPSDSGNGKLNPGDSIVVAFTNVPINQALGTTTLSIAERTSPAGGTLQYALAKFPYGFSFTNLTVVNPQTGAVVSQVARAQPVRLTWEGSVLDPNAYTVYYSTANGQQTGTLKVVNQWDLPNVYQDTIFNVQVTVSDQSGQPVRHTLMTSVSVASPNLIVTSLNLGGQDLAAQLATMSQSLVPKGTVAMWSGAANALPYGWALCDGTNDTPDLCNKFILGADPNNSLPAGKSGGSTSHNHTGSSSVSIDPVAAHTHGVPSPWYSNTASSGNGITIVDRRSTVVAGQQTQSSGGHDHGATAVVAVDPTSVLPPWYSLCFIIKQT
jgi:hypothetical protein